MRTPAGCAPRRRLPACGSACTCPSSATRCRGPCSPPPARDAEDAGADDLWVSDHVLMPIGSERPPAVFHDALTTLTWAAAATRRAGLGTSVLVAPYRHPLLLAKALASLDALSGGRVVCGLASGWMASEFAALGVPFGERGRRTDETIAAMRALWRGEPAFRWRGATVEGHRLLPPPARPGGPPLWIGGDSDAGVACAARAGDAWHTTTWRPEKLAPRLRALDAALQAAGRRRGDLLVSVRVRADVAAVRDLAPRLAALGVDHLLVDPPALRPERLGDEVAELRRITA
ncbi:TIGR03619 family F420-dependent LLM class oxidoreductase [Miltoncostaea marina]|uniref:TIGR03619 family F420-dependent LLM class oxidoreductase n=1 Tax=Miltoncostaea marina TaxID=2843215 RepID=UPI001C3E19A0|nr:TIGR03619 family F420-dependent LLM class oxidoreductase [Miltoncostaea marina]